jgi:hypothetical protein
LGFRTRFLCFENQVGISAVQIKQELKRIVSARTEKAMFQTVREAMPKDPDGERDSQGLRRRPLNS